MNLNYNVVHIALKAQASSYWYFDNGFYRYMVGDKYFFTNIILINDGYVTIGDGNKAMICGKQSISVPGILQLKDVEVLKENLISISQICDNKCLVKSTHKDCTFYDSLGNILVKGTLKKTIIMLVTP